MKQVALFAIGAAAYVLLAAAESNRQIRLASYRARLDVWHIRQQIAVRRYLAGETDDPGIVPPPQWEG